jgi:putative transcriptional regulator
MVKFLLSKLLGERKITQAQLAKATGIRAATINVLFHGNAHSISFENLDLICAELDCSICDILVRNNQVDYLIERGKVEVLSELLSVAAANAEKAVNEAQIKIDALTKQLDDAKSTYTPFALPDFKQMNEYESFVKRIEKATGKGMRLSVLHSPKGLQPIYSSVSVCDLATFF